jgi:diguanylate cyclase (GGDEF)-like protein
MVSGIGSSIAGMEKATLFQLAAPGRLPERAVFVLSIVAMLAIFVANILIADPSLRLYVLHVLPLLAIGMHSARRSLYVVGAVTALVLDAIASAHFGTPFLSLLGNLFLEGIVVVLCLSVAETARVNYQKVLNLARTDDLTGLMNRRAFVRSVGLEIERQARYGGEFSIMMLDLDGFKALNDMHGHLVGDLALRHLAEAIRNNTRRADSVARIGGDEFVVLMPNTPKVACDSICHQLRHAVAEGMRDSGYTVTASIGSVTFEEPPESVDAALYAADKAMYDAKQGGGDRVVSA